jgi:hypothetical protein
MRAVRRAALLATLALLACDRPATPSGARAQGSQLPSSGTPPRPPSSPSGPAVGSAAAPSSVPAISPKPPLPQDAAKAAAVLRCEAAMERAGRATQRAEALRLYHRECADLFARADCRKSWQTAAEQEASKGLRTLYDGCRAYCSSLADPGLELCTPAFKPARAALERAWSPFLRAVWRLELGAAASRIERAVDVGFNEGGERWPEKR